MFHGFLALHDPALDSPTAAPDPSASEAGGVVYKEWRHARLVLYPKKIAPSFDVHLFCSLHYWGVSTLLDLT